eukprot:Rhum_TRINITY_DN25038_c0_g1::Rhum_TRINITY_DN25038_c0_g1_i1::g.180992::m.180992
MGRHTSYLLDEAGGKQQGSYPKFHISDGGGLPVLVGKLKECVSAAHLSCGPLTAEAVAALEGIGRTASQGDKVLSGVCAASRQASANAAASADVFRQHLDPGVVGGEAAAAPLATLVASCAQSIRDILDAADAQQPLADALLQPHVQAHNAATERQAFAAAALLEAAEIRAEAALAEIAARPVELPPDTD